MAERHFAADTPELRAEWGDFAWSPANAKAAADIVSRYPAGRQMSASIPFLDLAQRQVGEMTGTQGWLPIPVIEFVARELSMPPIAVQEVASFYTMFNLVPVGKFHVQVCGTTPCMLRGAEALMEVCRSKIHHDQFDANAAGTLSWEEVECLGACVNAPMVLIWNDTYEDLTAESFEKVLDGFVNDKPVKPGPQIDRQLSAPVGGPTTLKTVKA